MEAGVVAQTAHARNLGCLCRCAGHGQQVPAQLARQRLSDNSSSSATTAAQARRGVGLFREPVTDAPGRCRSFPGSSS